MLLLSIALLFDMRQKKHVRLRRVKHFPEIVSGMRKKHAFSIRTAEKSPQAFEQSLRPATPTILLPRTLKLTGARLRLPPMVKARTSLQPQARRCMPKSDQYRRHAQLRLI